MSKEEKIIKDLKERNRSLNNQFRLRDIRVNILEQREIEKDKEIEKLHSIIKEVREYIEENTKWYDKELGLVEMEGYKTNRIPVIYLYGLLRILDKENSNGR